MKKPKIFDDFKKFAFKGNVMDMAIGIIIGSAFTSIINSLVNDIIMPVVGKFTAGLDYSKLELVISEAVYDDLGNVITPETAIRYGMFIQNIVYFLLVAVSCFIAIKLIVGGMNKLKHPPEPAPPPPPPGPTAQEKLLMEIRDILKK